MECATADSLEVFVADDAFEGEAIDKRHLFDDFELIGEGYNLEGRTLLECCRSDSFEVFVADDALECGAMGERQLFDDFELVGKCDTREGVAPIESCQSYIRNIGVFTEYHTHEMITIKERTLRNALKFGTS